MGEGWEERQAKRWGVGWWWWNRKTLGTWVFPSLAFCRGTRVGQLHLLLVALEQVLTGVHDTEGPEYLLLQPPGFQEFLTGISTGETAVTGSGRSRCT